MTEVELIGFAPDVEPTVKGVMVDCNGLIPSDKGFRALPGRRRIDNQANANISVFPDAEIVGAGAFRYGNTLQVFAGTRQKIWGLRYYGNTTATSVYRNWEDLSQPGGYTAFVPPSWHFEGFGDYVVAAAGNVIHGQVSHTLQVLPIQGTAFAPIAGAPKACIVVSVNRFLVALNIDGYGPGDGWKCCARDNHTDWALSAATNCAQGRLVDVPGSITAGIAFDDDLLVFKEQTFYLGRYVGAPEVWAFDKQPFGVGCVGPKAVTKDAVGKVYFLATDDLYVFDGATCRPLMSGRIKRWWLNEVNPAGINTETQVVYDAVRDLVWIVCRTTLQGDTMLSYHLRTGRWGRVQSSIRTWDLMFPIPVDYSDNYVGFFCSPGDTTLGLFDTSRRMHVLAGAYGSATGIPQPTFTTGDFGDISAATELRAARVKFTTAPSVSTCTPMHRAALDATLTTAAAVARQPGTGRYDLWQIDRWHRLQFDLGGDCEFSGYAVDADAVDEQ